MLKLRPGVISGVVVPGQACDRVGETVAQVNTGVAETDAFNDKESKNCPLPITNFHTLALGFSNIFGWWRPKNLSEKSRDQIVIKLW